MRNFFIETEGLKYPKYVQTLNIMNELMKRGEKAVLFDSSSSYIPFLFEFLSKHGIPVFIFTTQYDVTSRKKQMVKFKNHSGGAILLTTYKICGEGQNITEANHIIFLTQTRYWEDYYQAVGRCKRYPQKKTVHLHFLFSGKHDRYIYVNAVKKKKYMYK